MGEEVFGGMSGSPDHARIEAFAQGKFGGDAGIEPSRAGDAATVAEFKIDRGEVALDDAGAGDAHFARAGEVADEMSGDLGAVRHDSVGEADLAVFFNDEFLAVELPAHRPRVTENGVAGAVDGGVDRSADGEVVTSDLGVVDEAALLRDDDLRAVARDVCPRALPLAAASV